MNLQFLLSTNIFFSGKLRFASCHDSASMESDLRGYQVVHMLTAHMHYFVICIVYFLWLNICSFQGRLLASRILRVRLPMSWNYRGGISEEEDRHLLKWNEACNVALLPCGIVMLIINIIFCQCVWSSRWPRRWWWRPVGLCGGSPLHIRSIIPNSSNPNATLCWVFRNCCKIIVFVIYNPTTTDPKGQYSSWGRPRILDLVFWALDPTDGGN